MEDYKIDQRITRIRILAGIARFPGGLVNAHIYNTSGNDITLEVAKPLGLTLSDSSLGAVYLQLYHGYNWPGVSFELSEDMKLEALLVDFELYPSLP